MLVLSRKKGEEIVIDDTIRLVVVEIRGDKVRLGITAPKEIPVHRVEVAESIALEGERRSHADPTSMAGNVADRPGAA